MQVTHFTVGEERKGGKGGWAELWGEGGRQKRFISCWRPLAKTPLTVAGGEGKRRWKEEQQHSGCSILSRFSSDFGCVCVCVCVPACVCVCGQAGGVQLTVDLL